MKLFKLYSLLVLIILVSCSNPTQPSQPDAGGNHTQVGFWVNDIPSSQIAADEYSENLNGKLWVDAKKVLKYDGPRARVWVRQKDSALISTAMATDYGQWFENHSWPDVTGAVYPFATADFLGEPGDKINIFFYKAAPKVAGYFWSKDFFSDSSVLPYYLHSNETNIFYINISSAVSAGNQAGATWFTYGTLTHEFQHMANAHSYYTAGTGNMDSWQNEFCSTLMESLYAGQYYDYLSAYNSDYDGDDDNNGDFSTGQTQFLDWSSATFTQYSITSLLGASIARNLTATGKTNFVKNLLANTGISKTSIHALVKTLNDFKAASNYTAPANWVSVLSSDADYITDWSLIMKTFLVDLSNPGSNSNPATYAGFMQVSTDNSTRTGKNLTVTPVLNTNSNITLKSGAFIIGNSNSNFMTGTSTTDLSVSGGFIYPVKFYVWNGSFGSALATSPNIGSDFAIKPAFTSSSSVPSLLGKPVLKDSPNARMINFGIGSKYVAGPTSYAGAGDGSNVSDGTASGRLYCFYQ